MVRVPTGIIRRLTKTNIIRSLARRVTCFPGGSYVRGTGGGIRSTWREDGCKTTSPSVSGRWSISLTFFNFADRFIRSAIISTHHPRLPHRRRKSSPLQRPYFLHRRFAANPYGKLYWCDLGLRSRRVRDGIQVCCLFLRVFFPTDLHVFRCHLGKVILYDTVTKNGWSVSPSNHPIKVVIEKILSEDWDPENGVSVPDAAEQTDCVVCLSLPLIAM